MREVIVKEWRDDIGIIHRDEVGELIPINKEMIKKECFWYRPWKDMGATFDQCEVAPIAECPCKENCKWYISKADAEELVWTALQDN